MQQRLAGTDMHALYAAKSGGETVILIAICIGLTLLAGLVSGLTLGLMSLGDCPSASRQVCELLCYTVLLFWSAVSYIACLLSC